MQFSALYKQYWREYQPSKTAKLLGGKKVNEPYILYCIGRKFSEITETVMPFQYSEFLFY